MKAGVTPIAPELHPGLSEEVHWLRSRELGGADQGQRRHDRIAERPRRIS
jgi:hypothetical protein